MTLPPVINIIQSSSLTSPVINIAVSGSGNAPSTVVVTMHDALTSIADFADTATSASYAMSASYAASGPFIVLSGSSTVTGAVTLNSGSLQLNEDLTLGYSGSVRRRIVLWSDAFNNLDPTLGFGSIEVRQQNGVPTGGADNRGNEMVFVNRSYLAANSSGFKFIYSGSNVGSYNVLEAINHAHNSIFTVDRDGNLGLASQLQADVITNKLNSGNPLMISSSYGTTSGGPATLFINGKSHGIAFTWYDNAVPVLSLRGSDTTLGPLGALTLYGPQYFNADNAFDMGQPAVNRPRNVYIGTALSTNTINSYANAPYLFSIVRSDLSAVPFSMDTTGSQHASVFIGASPSGSGVYMSHGLQVTGGTLYTDSLSILGSAFIAGADKFTSGWTSIPIRPGQPTGNANDVAGLNLVVEGGQGTGVGARAGIQFQVGWATGSGSQILHPLQTGMFLTSGSLIVSGTINTMVSKTPASTSDTSGQIGDWCADDSFIYHKGPSGWKRAALSTF